MMSLLGEVKQAWQRAFRCPEKFCIPVENREVLEKHTVIVALPQGPALFYQIVPKNQDTPATWAFLEHGLDNKGAFLWFICTPEKMRRKGYARDLIHILQNRYDYLETHYSDDIINSPGVRLCLDTGFKPLRAMTKKMPHRLIWRKNR